MAETEARLQALLMAARVFHRLQRADELAVLARFLKQHYNFTVPPVHDAVTARGVAQRAARALFLAPAQLEAAE
jgi:hypothetical protein